MLVDVDEDVLIVIVDVDVEVLVVFTVSPVCERHECIILINGYACMYARICTQVYDVCVCVGVCLNVSV